jgi:hypothetical protein
MYIIIKIFTSTPLLFTSYRNGLKKASRAIYSCTLQLHVAALSFLSNSMYYMILLGFVRKFENCRKKNSYIPHKTVPVRNNLHEHVYERLTWL